MVRRCIVWCDNKNGDLETPLLLQWLQDPSGRNRLSIKSMWNVGTFGLFYFVNYKPSKLAAARYICQPRWSKRSRYDSIDLSSSRISDLASDWVLRICVYIRNTQSGYACMHSWPDSRKQTPVNACDHCLSWEETKPAGCSRSATWLYTSRLRACANDISLASSHLPNTEEQQAAYHWNEGRSV